MRKKVLIEKILCPKFILDDGTRVFVNKHGREKYGTPAPLFIHSQIINNIENPILGQISFSTSSGLFYIYLESGWVEFS